MVIPRKTSSETIRPERAASRTAGLLGAAMVSAVAMRGSSARGDSTAAWMLPQSRAAKTCRKTKKARPGGGPGHAFLRGKKLALALCGLGV